MRLKETMRKSENMQMAAREGVELGTLQIARTPDKK